MRGGPEARQGLGDLSTTLDAAVEDAAHWVDVCDGLARCFDGVGTIMVPIDVFRRGPLLVHSPGLRRHLKVYSEAGWLQSDFRPRTKEFLREHGVACDLDLDDAEAIGRSPYHRFLESNGFGGALRLYFAVGDSEWVASIQWSPGRYGLEDHERALAQRARALLQDAASRARARLADHFAQWEAFASGRDWGLAFLDRDASVHFANARLDAFGALPDVVSSGRFELPDRRDDRRLRELLARAADPSDERLMPAPIVTAARSQRSLIVDVARLPLALRHFTSGVVAAVTIREACAAGLSLEDWLAREYRLIPSELKVASGVSLGLKPSEIARGLGLTEGTVRQLLKSIFRKTGANSQLKLLALMAARPEGAERG